MEDQEVEIPEYFVCPISLQIMKDPVTAVTGITYDRDSIERWLAKPSRESATCPVTKQSLPGDSDLTPNHTLRRLIQAWCVTNAKNGVERIPTPKSPIERSCILKLVRELRVEGLYMKALRRLEELCSDTERNRACLLEAGVAEAIISLVINCVKERKVNGLHESLRILNMIWSSTRSELKDLFKQTYEFIDALTWILRFNMGNNNIAIKVNAAMILKKVTEVASLVFLERLKIELFKALVSVLAMIKTSQQGIKSVLQVLIDACPWGRNRIKIVEAGAVFRLIELELEKPEKRVSELIFALLAQLCSVADGRAQLLEHAGGIALVSKRTLRVSPAVDDRAIHILSMISKHSGTNDVLFEMLRVGAVSKLCMVLQADCATQLKNKARSTLRLHSNVWNNSPCIQVYLLTRHAAR